VNSSRPSSRASHPRATSSRTEAGAAFHSPTAPARFHARKRHVREAGARAGRRKPSLAVHLAPAPPVPTAEEIGRAVSTNGEWRSPLYAMQRACVPRLPKNPRKGGPLNSPERQAHPTDASGREGSDGAKRRPAFRFSA
jgi:hypothetical protein